jgi:carbonic anhydrase
VTKIFHFDSPRERYVCDAAVVWCFDNRFEIGFRKFLKKIGVEYWDAIKVAGGAKFLASPDRESDREFVLEQIRLSMRLHQTRRVIIMLHSDCGAYGGLDGAFGGDEKAEAEHHVAELRRATEKLSTAIPGITVDAYYVNFEGVWRTDNPAIPRGTEAWNRLLG